MDEAPVARPGRRRPRRRLRLPHPLVVLLLGIVLAPAACSLTYNVLTDQPGLPPQALARGPFVRAAGVLTHYERWGRRGSAVVLVPGFAQSTYVWHRVAPLLARAHVVYALDLRGFGYSERKDPFTLAADADQVQGFLAALRIDRPVLVGHGSGAAVVAEVARRAPGSVRGIVLADGDALAGPGPPLWARPLLVQPFRTSVIRLVSRSDLLLGAILERACGPGCAPPDGRALAAWQDPFRVAGSEAALAAVLGRPAPGVTPAALAGIRVPALVVWGAVDASRPLDAGWGAARALRARLVVIPDAGHLSMVAAPGPFAAAVERLAAATGRPG